MNLKKLFKGFKNFFGVNHMTPEEAQATIQRLEVFRDAFKSYRAFGEPLRIRPTPALLEVLLLHAKRLNLTEAEQIWMRGELIRLKPLTAPVAQDSVDDEVFNAMRAFK